MLTSFAAFFRARHSRLALAILAFRSTACSGVSTCRTRYRAEASALRARQASGSAASCRAMYRACLILANLSAMMEVVVVVVVITSSSVRSI